MRFQGTGSESALALGAETAFGIGNTTLTEFIPVTTFDVVYEVNKRDTPVAQMAQKLPAYSSRGAQRQTWAFTAPLWADGLEFFWEMAMGRYQDTGDVTSPGIGATPGTVFAHTFLGSSGAIPLIDGLATDPLCDGMAMGFYTGDLSPARGRFVKLRGCLVSRFSVNIAPGGATLSADGIFYDACFNSTAPTLAWDAGYLFTPLDTNISFADSTTGSITQSLNQHWLPWNWTLNWDNKIDQDFPFFYNALLPRNPATPYRQGPVEVTINFEVDAMSGAGGGGTQLDRSYDASMTREGKTFRQVYENSLPFHGYIESFGAAVYNFTTATGDPRRRTFKFLWDYAQLTDWKTPYTGAGNYRHRCEAQLFEPPGLYTGEMAVLYLTNTRAGFAQYPTGL